MIIDDLEHIELITEKNNCNQSRLIEGGLTFIPPIINFQASVIAGAIPSTLKINFTGAVMGSEYSFLRVIQEGFVRARSPI